MSPGNVGVGVDVDVGGLSSEVNDRLKFASHPIWSRNMFSF